MEAAPGLRTWPILTATAVAIATGMTFRQVGRQRASSAAIKMVPTTIAGHPFWEIDDPVKRSQQRVQFLKNTGILGGLLVLALD